MDRERREEKRRETCDCSLCAGWVDGVLLRLWSHIKARVEEDAAHAISKALEEVRSMLKDQRGRESERVSERDIGKREKREKS